MKFKVAKKDFADCVVYKVGYCQLQYLLPENEAIAYSSGVCGWSCDYFDLGSFYISTGYAPIGKELPYKLIQKYNAKSEKISSFDYEKAKKQKARLMKQFIAEVNAL